MVECCGDDPLEKHVWDGFWEPGGNESVVCKAAFVLTMRQVLMLGSGFDLKRKEASDGES